MFLYLNLYSVCMINGADYSQLKDQFYDLSKKLKDCERKLFTIERSITSQLKPICDTFCVFDNTYTIKFMSNYISIVFISTNSFTVIIPYESVHKIKTWNDLIKYKLKGRASNG